MTYRVYAHIFIKSQINLVYVFSELMASRGRCICGKFFYLPGIPANPQWS